MTATGAIPAPRLSSRRAPLTGPSRRRGPRAALLALVVLAVAFGVLAMHSMGAGHAAMGTGHPAMSQPAAPTVATDHALTGRSGISPPAAGPAAVGAQTLGGQLGCAADRCHQQAAGDTLAAHGDMSTTCLAVMPGMGLLLLGLLLLRRHRSHPVLLVLTRPVALAPIRAGPATHLTPSLSQLCILRT